MISWSKNSLCHFVCLQRIQARTSHSGQPNSSLSCARPSTATGRHPSRHGTVWAFLSHPGPTACPPEPKTCAIHHSPTTGTRTSGVPDHFNGSGDDTFSDIWSIPRSQHDGWYLHNISYQPQQGKTLSVFCWIVSECEYIDWQKYFCTTDTAAVGVSEDQYGRSVLKC